MPANVTPFELHIDKSQVSVGIQSVILFKVLAKVLTLKAVWGFGERTQNNIIWSRPLAGNQAPYLLGCVKHPLLYTTLFYLVHFFYPVHVLPHLCEPWKLMRKAGLFHSQFAFWCLLYHWRKFRGLQAMDLVSWILKAVLYHILLWFLLSRASIFTQILQQICWKGLA